MFSCLDNFNNNILLNLGASPPPPPSHQKIGKFFTPSSDEWQSLGTPKRLYSLPLHSAIYVNTVMISERLPIMPLNRSNYL